MVLQALPKACKVDMELCTRVQRDLDRSTRTDGVTNIVLYWVPSAAGVTASRRQQRLDFLPGES